MSKNSQEEINLADIPAKVQRIHLDGLGRTKDDFVSQQVKRVFKATNFEEMVRKAEEARMQMEQLGLFKKVRVYIDTAKGTKARPDGYEITYTVVEPRVIAGGISTLVGTNDGSLLFNMRLPNTFGRAERITAEYTYGTRATAGYSLTFHKPLLGNPNISLNVGGFQHSGEYPWSGYKETDRGGGVELAFPSVFGSHSVRWEGVWRDLGCLSNSTAFAVREQAGHSLKSSLKHIFVRDRRNDHILPSDGYMLRIIQELAGLGGDVNFVKHEEEFQINKSLIYDTVIQFSLAGGVTKSLKPEEPLRINDRFFLGGPLSLRGFNIKGAGPQADGSALGADAYWISGLHLYTPLPFRPGKGGFGELFRTHFFINAGNLANIDINGNWRDNVHNLVDTVRLSYGAGIVLKLGGIARLELNYCVPFRSQRTDRMTYVDYHMKAVASEVFNDPKYYPGYKKYSKTITMKPKIQQLTDLLQVAGNSPTVTEHRSVIPRDHLCTVKTAVVVNVKKSGFNQTDDDDFEAEIPKKGAATDKWEGEDEDDDVKDNWDDEDAEDTEKEDENENKAVQIKKKKPLKERLAEKEEQRKRELEEKKRKEEELKKQLKPLTPEERAVEKQRIQREQEEADLALAMEAFGSVPSNNELSGKSIDKMNPSSRDDFDTFEALLKEKITQYEKSPHYVYFLDNLIRDLSLGLEPEDLKKLGSALNALSNEKSKQQKAGKGKKKSTKAKIMAVRDDDYAKDFGDDLGGEYDDFI